MNVPVIVYGGVSMVDWSDVIAALQEAERGPEAGDLDDAPLLSRWSFTKDDPFLLAVGDVTGHPTVAGPHIVTSPVLGFDLDRGWMRTRSRFYRLGHPAQPAQLTTIEGEAQRLLAVLRRKALDQLHGEVPRSDRRH